MTELISEGVRQELVLRELGEVVLWLKSLCQGINNMDTAMRANHSAIAGALNDVAKNLNALHGIRRTLDEIEVNTRKPPSRRKTKRCK